MRTRALASLAALSIGSLAACESSLDLDRARRVLERPAAPTTPLVRDDAVSDLPAVEGLRAGSGELRSIPLRWQPVLSSGVTGYLVERARAAGAPFERVAAVGGQFGTVYVDRGNDAADKAANDLGDGESYVYRVRAVHRDGGVGAPSLPEVGRTAPLPERPTGFRAISQLPRQVALSWEPSPDPIVTGYVISRSPSELGEFLPVARLSGRFATTHVDDGLGDLRVFYYRVSAVNGAGGVGEASHAERAVTKPEPLPPSHVRAVTVAVGRNELRWAPNVEADLAGYHVLRELEGAPVRIGELAKDAVAFVDESVGAAETITYWVEAFDHDGLVSRPAGPFEVASLGYGLSARMTSEGVRLSWTAEDEPAWTAVRVWRLGALSRDEIGDAAGDGFVDPDPGAGLRRYQIAGVRPDGTLAPISQPVEIEVPPASAE